MIPRIPSEVRGPVICQFSDGDLCLMGQIKKTGKFWLFHVKDGRWELHRNMEEEEVREYARRPRLTLVDKQPLTNPEVGDTLNQGVTSG